MSREANVHVCVKSSRESYTFELVISCLMVYQVRRGKEEGMQREEEEEREERRGRKRKEQEGRGRKGREGTERDRTEREG